MRGARAIAAVFLTFNAMFQYESIRTPRWLGYIFQRPRRVTLCRDGLRSTMQIEAKSPAMDSRWVIPEGPKEVVSFVFH